MSNWSPFVNLWLTFGGRQYDFHQPRPFGVTFRALWLTLGLLSMPFGSLLKPFGSLLVSLNSLLVSLVIDFLTFGASPGFVFHIFLKFERNLICMTSSRCAEANRISDRSSNGFLLSRKVISRPISTSSLVGQLPMAAAAIDRYYVVTSWCPACGRA